MQYKILLVCHAASVDHFCVALNHIFSTHYLVSAATSNTYR